MLKSELEELVADIEAVYNNNLLTDSEKVKEIKDYDKLMKDLGVDSFEEYAKRLTQMEDIAKKFDGVEDAYAFEAGRELRVIINPGALSDEETTVLAVKIRDEVSKALAVPGEIKVTAIREFRAVSTEFSS